MSKRTVLFRHDKVKILRNDLKIFNYIGTIINIDKSEMYPCKYEVEYSDNKKGYFKKEELELYCNHDCLKKVVPYTKTGYKMKRICSHCNEIIEKEVNPPTTFEGLLRLWINKKPIKNHRIKHYNFNEKELYYEGSGRKVSYGKDVLVVKLENGMLIGNASKLERCGSYRKGDAPAQMVLRDLKIPLIPFNVIQEAGFDIQTIKIINTTGFETIRVPKLIFRDDELKPIEIWELKNTKRKPRKEWKVKNVESYNKNIYEKDEEGYNIYSKILRKEKWYRYSRLNFKNLENRPFIGAILFTVSKDDNKKYYLFDCDRNELKYYNFNAFLTELPKPCETVKEAYELLKPKEIILAEKKGIKVIRQGEWFFIPTKIKPYKGEISNEIKELANKTIELDQYDLHSFWDGDLISDNDVKSHFTRHKIIDERIKENYFQRVRWYNEDLTKILEAKKIMTSIDPDKFAIRGQLKAGESRPNNVGKYISIPQGTFVKGIITHSGRQHEPIFLNDWHKPIPNTAIKNWTIRGNID